MRSRDSNVGAGLRPAPTVNSAALYPVRQLRYKLRKPVQAPERCLSRQSDASSYSSDGSPLDRARRE